MMKKIVLLLMVLFAFGGAYAQQPFSQVDHWLDVHAAEMGGRLMLVVYKDGKMILRSCGQRNEWQTAGTGQADGKKEGNGSGFRRLH